MIKFTNLNCSIQWILTSVCIHVTISIMKLQTISITPKKSLELFVNHYCLHFQPQATTALLSVYKFAFPMHFIWNKSYSMYCFDTNLLLSLMLSRFIYVVAYITILVCFLLLNIFLCMDIPHFVYSTPKAICIISLLEIIWNNVPF